MSVSFYEIRQCQNPGCGLRYPQTNTDMFGDRCPTCLGETWVLMKRELPPHPQSDVYTQFSSTKEIKGCLIPLLDNVRSAWNVGSIFRTADGIGIPKLYLCGITPTPENLSVQKTSLGAEKYVEWEYSPNALITTKKLLMDGFKLIALEQDQRSIPINQFRILDSHPMILILGNEVSGVDTELLNLCDYHINIPMLGQNRSFNVEVAFAIAAYTLMNFNDS